LPILSADFGSANEFIENGKTGWICPIKDMPNRISDIICNQDEYLSVKNNLKDFSFDNDKLLRLIDSLLR
jgi:glycosyltransferase involved in cell wall biosynthesis